MNNDISKQEILELVQCLTELKATAEALYKRAEYSTNHEHYLGEVGDDLTNAYDAAHTLLRTYG